MTGGGGGGDGKCTMLASDAEGGGRRAVIGGDGVGPAAGAGTSSVLAVAADNDEAAAAPVGGGGGRSPRSDDSGDDDDKRWLPSLRWTPSVRVKFLRAIESVDIAKHWRHGSKAAFWYLVLETLWAQQGYEDKYKQPHINSLNMKFFEIYDAHMEGTGEAGPSGSGARSSRNKLGPKDLGHEENEICTRIKEKFEPIRGGVGSHKQPRAKLGEVGPGARRAAPTAARKRKRVSRSASTSRQTSALAEERGPGTGVAAHSQAPQPQQTSVGQLGSINAYEAATAATAAAGDHGGHQRAREEELLLGAALGRGESRHRMQRSPSLDNRPHQGRPIRGREQERGMEPVDRDEYLFLLLESRIHTFVEKLGETIDVETQRHGTEASIWLAQEEFSRRKVALLSDHLEEAAAHRSTLNSLIQDNRLLLETILLEQQSSLAPGRR